jgi:hypothetical protein
MTKLQCQAEVKCPYSRAALYLDRYLSLLGWSGESPVGILRLRAPLSALGIGGDVSLSRDVLATLTPSAKGRGLEHPIDVVWNAEDALFPVFEGRLAITAKSPTASTLSLEGSYKPPLGAVGKAFDAALGHKIAEATARELLRDIRERIEHEYLREEPHLAK